MRERGGGKYERICEGLCEKVCEEGCKGVFVTSGIRHRYPHSHRIPHQTGPHVEHGGYVQLGGLPLGDDRDLVRAPLSLHPYDVSKITW